MQTNSFFFTLIYTLFHNWFCVIQIPVKQAQKVDISGKYKLCLLYKTCDKLDFMMSGLFLKLNFESNGTNDDYNLTTTSQPYSLKTLEALIPFLPFLFNSSDLFNDYEFGNHDGSLR